MKKVKLKIISTFVLLIMLISNFLPISFATYQNLVVNETNIDIVSNTVENENITNLQENNNIVPKDNNEVEENIIKDENKEITNFDVLLSGILITDDLELTNSKVKEIISSNEQLVKSNGIWIEDNSRNYFLNLINSVSNENYIIDEEGFLRYDENNVKKTDDKKEKYNFYTSKIDELISSEKTLIVSIEDCYKSLNLYDNEISNISNIIILNKKLYNIDNSQNSEMILMNKFLETFYHEDEDFKKFILDFEQYIDTSNENTNNFEGENEESLDEEEPLDTPLEIDFNENELNNFDVVLSGILYDADNITIENINKINDIKPNEYGIWVEENSKYAFLKFLNNHGIYTYSINESGYLICDNIMKDNINLDFKDVTEVDLEIATILSENVTLYVTIDNKYLSNETGIVTYSYLDQEEYVKTFDNEELDNRIVILNSQYFNNNTEFDLAISDRFVKRIFDYGQGIELYSDTSKYGYMTQSRNVYFGPNDTDYAKVGSVDNNEKVYLLGKSAGWYHIQYHVGSTGTQKSGFVPESTVKNIVANPAVHEEVLTGGHRYANTKITIYSCDNLSIAVSVGSVFEGESVNLIYSYAYSGSNGNYNISYVEYATSSGTKRGYTYSSNLSAASYVTYIARVITTSSAYSGPDSTYVKLGGAYYNEYVSILAKSGDWCFAEYNTTSGRKRGYMKLNCLSEANPSSSINGFSSNQGLKKADMKLTVYGGPNSNYANIGSIFNQEVVSFLTTERGFAYIEYSTNNGAKRGYVDFSHLKSSSPPTIPDIPEYNGFTIGTYGSSGLNKILKYYKIGYGENIAFAVFEQHGWEDAWASDGIELVNIADRVMYNLSSTGVPSNWTVYVIPYANPDGITNGYTNNGPGRCTVTSKVDMNRCWPAQFEPNYTSRNYTGGTELGAKEASALKNLIENTKGNKENIILDIHGWLNKTYGDASVAKYFGEQFGFGHSSTYGNGYLETWGKSIGAKSVLVELPMPSSSEDIINRDFSGKLSNSIQNMLSGVSSVEGGTEVYENAIVSTSGNLNIRSGPSTSYSIVATVPNGTKVIRIRKEVAIANGYTWDKIRLENGTEGYVASNYLNIVAPYEEIPVAGHVYVKNQRDSLISEKNKEKIAIGNDQFASRDIVEIYEDMFRLEDIQKRLQLLCIAGIPLETGDRSLFNFYNCTGQSIHHPNMERLVSNSEVTSNKLLELQHEALIAAETIGKSDNNFVFSLKQEDEFQIGGGYNIYGRPLEEAILEAASSIDQFDWFMAFGYTRIALMCNVEISNNITKMTMTYTLKDYYDWDKTNESIVGNLVTQKELWELNFSGLARNFEQEASFVRILEWNTGDLSNVKTVSEYSS